MSHFVYIIECRNGNYYTGYTSNVKRRYSEHLKGTKKCRYTRSFPPKKLVAYWQFANRSDALVVEHMIKQMSKREKKQLLIDFDKINLKISQSTK